MSTPQRHEPSAEDPARPNTPEVVATLVEGHREFLAFLERRTGDRAVAEDLLQEAFVRGLDKLGQLRDEESARAWFYRVLRNAEIDHFRRAGSESARLETLAERFQERQDDLEEVEDAICGCIARLARTLKPEYSEAIQRIELDGLSLADFAREAGIQPGNAAVRVHRARQALRRQVARACGTCAEHGCLDCTCGASHGGGC